MISCVIILILLISTIIHNTIDVIYRLIFKRIDSLSNFIEFKYIRLGGAWGRRWKVTDVDRLHQTESEFLKQKSWNGN